MIGISIGFALESKRTNKILEDYKFFEIEALDLKLQNYYYQTMNQASCDIALDSNLKFADDIYSEGLIIDKYEEAEEFSQNILLAKKRYILLKTELWLNSILLKNKCGDPFHTVIYIYSQTDDMKKDVEQEIVSKELKNLKEKYGNEIILIPIAGDLGLDSIEIQLQIYNVTYLPSIIIDEEIVLEGFHSVEELEKFLE
jgi:hypothetical protein